MAYNTSSKSSYTGKIVLATIDPTLRISTWTLHGGAVYKEVVDWKITNVKVGATSLIEGSSTSLNAGEWYADCCNKIVYIRMSDDSNPNNSLVSVVYRMFFSNYPINLPHDLDAGYEVYWQPFISGVSEFPQGIDPSTQFGISLESSGSIKFYNNDFFIDYFDRLFWENKSITIYSYLLEDDSYKVIFSGEITNKAYTPTSITFNIKDFVHKLQKKISADLYTTSDGDFAASIIGKPKRTIYGKVDGLIIQSTDQVLGGYDLTGTISGANVTASMTGVGTDFLNELSVDDEIQTTISNVNYSYRVDTISSGTQLTLSENPDVDFSGESATIIPSIPYRYKNRKYIVSGHKLRTPSTTIADVLSYRSFRVDDISDFLVDDIVLVGSEYRTITAISINLITVDQDLTTLPTIGVTVVKEPINKMYFNKKELVINRDWTVTTNDSTGCEVTLEDDAEVNHTILSSLPGTVTLTNGSINVSGVGTEFSSKLNPRDWIRSTDVNHAVWYEILSITDNSNLTLRTAYAGVNRSGAVEKKNVTYIDDDSIVTVNTVGKENSNGEWVKTASNVVKDLLINAGITDLNTDSFYDADIEAPFIMSLKIPFDVSGNLPKTRDIIDEINKSVFGSLVTKNDYSIAFNILSAERPAAAAAIGDDDIKSFSVSTQTDIIRKFIGRYRHQDSDIYRSESSFSIEEYESDFVDALIGSEKDLEDDVYLYNASDVQTIAQRYVYFKSLTQSVLLLRGANLYLADKEINEKVYISLQHIYKRYGNANDQSKIGIISAIKRNGDTVSIDVSDLGNIFNRTSAITANDANDFGDASNSELIHNGYIVDNDTELPDTSNDETITNLIG